MSRFYAIAMSTLICAVFFTAQANAQTSRIYVSGYMGLSVTGDQNFSDDTSATTGDVEFKNALSFAGALGLRLSRNTRVELEASYKSYDTDRIDYSAGGGSSDLGGSLKNWNGLVNIYYDFDVPWKVQPYVGAGVGVGFFEGDINASGGPFISDDATGLLWQAGAGLKYRTRSNVAFTAGYRYLDSTDLDIGGFDLEYSDHEIRVGVEYDLGY